MHRQILGLAMGEKEKGDHIDRHNTLDNSRKNLRRASDAQNGANRGPNSNNTSGYKGVYWDKRRSKWMACIYCNNTRHFLGAFSTKDEAYASYCTAAKLLHGEFARFE
jgi:hypothetical protein